MNSIEIRKGAVHKNRRNADSISGADLGFLEREFICIKGVGVRFADLSHFLKYPIKTK